MSDIEPGTLIENRYYVEAEIGRGGMAAVYRVRHAQLGTLAAMKVLTLPAASIQQRLMQEGRVQAALQHPNIVAVSDVIVHNGAPGLVMEYVRGPSLDDFLIKRRLTVEQSDEIANGIIRGVGAAHKHGLIHRDLKPANIMLAITNEGLIPKITDFGLVKMILGESDGMSRTRSGVAMGTPSYMAPEQISDAKTVDERADIFSLGAILYELTSNVRAFEGTDMFKIFSAIVGGTYQPIRELVPELPERMEAAIHGALEPDRDKRIANIDRLLAIWQGESDLDDPDQSRGPWDADLLAEVSTMGAGGESSADSLRRSFKGSLPLPTQSPAHSPGPFDPGKTGATVSPHPSDLAAGSADPGASGRRTQSTMAPIPGMFDEPMPDSAQSPVPSTVPIPVAEPLPGPEPPPTPAPSALSSRLGLAVVGVLGVLVFGGATVATAGGSWALGLFDSEQPVPEPVPVAPDPKPMVPDPEPVAPEPEPVAPSPVKPDPRPATPDPAPIAPIPEPVEPEPVAPDPEPVAPDPEPVAPDPEPVSAAPTKPEVWIDSGGITVSLLGPDGRPANLRKLVAGKYRVIAFFTPNIPSEQGVLDIADGENWQVRCVPSARRCVIEQR